MKKIICLLLSLLLALTLFGCSSTQEQITDDKVNESAADIDSQLADNNESGDTTEEEKTYKIGWSVQSWVPFNSGLDDYLQQAYAKYDNVELITACAEGDSLKQISDVEDLIRQGVDMIIIKCNDQVTICPALAEARAQGIEVMLLQRTIESDDYDYYCGADMVNVGRTVGEKILEAFPDGNFNYVFLEGNAGSATDLETVEGAERVFTESGLPGIVKLDGQKCAASRADGKKLMEDWLTAYGEEIDVVISVNDEILIGVLQAIEERGLEKEFFITGCNAVAELLPKVADGTVDLTFALGPGVFPLVEMSVKILNGEGDEFSNFYEIPTVPITPEMAQEYLDYVQTSGIYMVGLLPPAQNPLYTNIGELYPELLPLLSEES